MLRKTNNYIDRAYTAILLVIFGGIVLHAPISVALGSLFPDYNLLIKSWKEILMLLAAILAIYLLYKNKKFYILKTPLIWTIIAFAALHFILLFINNQGLLPSLAGLIIDLRYLFFFVLVYVAIVLYPERKNDFIKIGIIGALIVLLFGALQVFVLPKDVLKYIGYSDLTIAPYLTVDKNEAYVRINSTLRGPNPLGAYSMIALVFAVVALLKNKIKKRKKLIIVTSLLIFGGLISLWFSYSRSALVGAAVALGLVFVAISYKKLSIKKWLLIGFIPLIALAGLFAFRDSDFVSHVILHENPSEGNNVNSNEGHLKSLSSGLDQILTQPLGEGIGSTGSASMLGDETEVVESQYLFVAHESGWLGLAYFLSIFSIVLWQAWDKRKDWLALGVFASGIGLALIGLLLPVFADDTVSIIWWGLAGIIIGLRMKK